MNLESLHKRFLASLHANDLRTSLYSFMTFIACRIEYVFIEEGLDPYSLTDQQALSFTDNLFNSDEFLFLINIHDKEYD